MHIQLANNYQQRQASVIGGWGLGGDAMKGDTQSRKQRAQSEILNLQREKRNPTNPSRIQQTNESKIVFLYMFRAQRKLFVFSLCLIFC